MSAPACTRTTPSARLGFGKFIGPTITLWDSIPGDHYGLGINNSELQTFMPATAHFSFNVGGDFQPGGVNEIMRVQGNGNVGIGTTTPNNLLSLGGGATATFGMDPNPSAASPGNTLTVNFATSGDVPKQGADLVAVVDTNRSRAEEIARGVVFLADPDSDYINGSTLAIDGGSQLPWWSKRGTGEF